LFIIDQKSALGMLQSNIFADFSPRKAVFHQ
jgi:hypothetical protein